MIGRTLNDFEVNLPGTWDRMEKMEAERDSMYSDMMLMYEIWCGVKGSQPDNVYHKIQTVYKRDPETKFKTLLCGDYSLPEFEFLKDNKWVFTEKVDGTNIRVIFDKGECFYRGKTDNAQLHLQLVERLHDLFDVGKMADMFDSQVCLYGEGYGPKIQSGGKYKSSQDFVLFDVKVGDWWLRRKDVEDIAETLGLDIVPIIGEGTLNDMVDMTRKGFYSLWGNFIAEGIVARPETELMTRSGNRIITKIKHRDFK